MTSILTDREKLSQLLSTKGALGEALGRMVLETPCCSCCGGDEEYERIVGDEVALICTKEELASVEHDGKNPEPVFRVHLKEDNDS